MTSQIKQGCMSGYITASTWSKANLKRFFLFYFCWFLNSWWSLVWHDPLHQPNQYLEKYQQESKLLENHPPIWKGMGQLIVYYHFPLYISAGATFGVPCPSISTCISIHPLMHLLHFPKPSSKIVKYPSWPKKYTPLEFVIRVHKTWDLLVTAHISVQNHDI